MASVDFWRYAKANGSDEQKARFADWELAYYLGIMNILSRSHKKQMKPTLVQHIPIAIQEAFNA